jgi:hypothetical protein
MKAIARLGVTCLSLVWLAACTGKEEAKSDEEGPDAGMVATATELEPGKTAASLHLHTVAEQLQGNEIADVVALEAKLNDPEAGLSAVDIDEDGVIDFVQVVEKREGDKTVLTLQAIPSSKKGEDVAKIAVEVATIELEVKPSKAKETEKTIVVHATYTEHIHHDAEIHVYHHEVPVVVEHGVLVLEEGCFFHHVFIIEHELYVGHHGHVVVEVHHDHHVHKKHHKHKKHKKHHKHKHHGGHGVVISW